VANFSAVWKENGVKCIAVHSMWVYSLSAASLLVEMALLLYEYLSY